MYYVCMTLLLFLIGYRTPLKHSSLLMIIGEYLKALTILTHHLLTRSNPAPFSVLGYHCLFLIKLGTVLTNCSQ